MLFACGTKTSENYFDTIITTGISLESGILVKSFLKLGKVKKYFGIIFVSEEN